MSRRHHGALGPAAEILRGPVDEPRPARHRRPVLALIGLVLVGLTVVLEFLLLGSFREVDRNTERFASVAYAVTNLSNVQRETIALGRDLEQLLTADDVAAALDDVQVRAALLANQWRLFLIEEAELRPDAAEIADLDAISRSFDAVFADVEQLTPASITAVAPRLRARLRELDVQVKVQYDASEIPFIDAFDQALHNRTASGLTLLALSVGIVSLGALFFVLARRGVRRDFNDAYDRLARSEDKYRTVVDQVSEAIVRLDADGRVVFANRAWSELSGVDLARSLGVRLLDFIEPMDRPAVSEVLDRRPRSAHRLDVQLTDWAGEVRWVELRLRPGRNRAWSATMADVTDRVRHRGELERIALVDTLTGLANRPELARRLDEALAAGDQSGGVAVLFLDLDRFKLVNDGLGHDTGDQLLIAVGDRITKCLRSSDTAARVGGDEFVILCAGLPADPSSAAAEALAVANRIASSLREPFFVGDLELRVSASLGIAVAREGQLAPELLSHSDAAMYHAKDRGKDRVELFDEELRHAVERRVEVERHLHHAVQRGELRLWLQPVFRLADGSLSRLEALLRWQHPERGLLLPADFLEAAEETGRIVEIGSWILAEACRAAAAWPGTDACVPAVSVNVSPRQLRSGRLPGELRRILVETGLAPDRLCLEITESCYLDIDAGTLADLDAIHALGVQLAMDDFGTGWSSLSALRQLPIDVVKLDRSFVAGLGAVAEDEAIVGSVIDLGRALGFETVAEGVETEVQLQRLRELGCDEVQGFLLGSPIPVDEAASLVAERPAPTIAHRSRALASTSAATPA